MRSPLPLSLLLACATCAPADPATEELGRARQGLTTLSLQSGNLPDAGYVGAKDTYIGKTRATTAHGSGTTLSLDNADKDDAVTRTLLYWDLSQVVPQMAQIQSASLTVTAESDSKGEVLVWQIQSDWSEAEATWNHRAAGVNWDTPGLGTKDRGAAPVDMFVNAFATTGTKTIPLGPGSVCMLQRWVNQPPTNHGLLLENLSTDGIDLDSREDNTVADRPKLTLVYEEWDGGVVPVCDAGILVLPDAGQPDASTPSMDGGTVLPDGGSTSTPDAGADAGEPPIGNTPILVEENVKGFDCQAAPAGPLLAVAAVVAGLAARRRRKA